MWTMNFQMFMLSLEKAKEPKMKLPASVGSSEKPESSRNTSAAKSLQSCPTLCDPINGSPPGSPIPGILQARTLEWVAISFSNAWKWKVKVKSLSRVRPSVTPWTAAFQALTSMGFSKQEYWSGVPLPSPFCFIDYAKAFDCVDLNKLENSERDGNIRPPDLLLEKSVCKSGSKS